jgi:hypothetical protein
VVAAEISRTSGLASRPGGFAGLLALPGALIRAVILLVKWLLSLLSTRQYAQWHRLNRATGRFWRSVPVAGPAGDNLLPTRAARVLRSILDEAWFDLSFAKRQPGDDEAAGPQLPYLLYSLGSESRRRCPRFESLFDHLQGENVRKRALFGSIMEAEITDRKVYRSGFLRRAAVVAVLAAFTAAAASGIAFWLLRAPGGRIVRSTPEGTARLDGWAEPSGSPKQAPNEAAKKSLKGSPNPGIRHAPRQQPRNAGRTPSPAPVPAVSSPPPPQPPAEPPAPPPCLLEPVDTKLQVYRVSGTCDSCNLADIRFDKDGARPEARLGDLSSSSVKYFVSRATRGAHGEIVAARKCWHSQCVKGVFYEAVGILGNGKPVTVAPGDLVGMEYGTLRQYVQKKRIGRSE